MNLRLRGDLQFTKRDRGLDSVWIVKDPVSFGHFLLAEHEFALANLIDEENSIDDVLKRWTTKFRSTVLSANQIESFVQRLLRDKLLVVDRPGYGRSLVNERRMAGVSSLASAASTKGSWWGNPLAIRFRGINPSRLLREFDWLGHLLFHPVVVVSVMLASVLTLLFMLGNFEAISERIPTIEQLLSRRGMIGMIATLVIVKMLHELGHALACRKFGGECFEIGVMLLAFIPTLFTNVTDAWTIPERWKRMMVSFAGIYIEICLASIAAVAWFLTPPGLLNALLFNVVFLCSVNTLLVNGNPLLRYDGYFLLSDWLEKPNLSQQAHAELCRAKSLLSRKPKSKEPFNRWLLAYAIASYIYRWFVVGLILWTFCSFAAKWNASMLGFVICGTLILGMAVFRMKNKTKMNPITTYERPVDAISWMRVSASGVLLAGIVAFVSLLPLSKSVFCEFQVVCENEVPVYSPADGNLIELVSVNQPVRAGEVIGQIENIELVHAAKQKQLELDQVKNQLQQFEIRINESPEFASKIGTARKKVEVAESELDKIKEHLQKLVLVSPANGIVLRSHVSQIDYQEVSNEGCAVRRSDNIIVVGDDGVLSIIAWVPESQIGLVEIGQNVWLKFDRVSDSRYKGQIQDVFSDQEFEGGETGTQELLEKTVRVSIGLEQFPVKVRVGSLGRGRISVQPQTIADRVGRLLRTAMNSRL